MMLGSSEVTTCLAESNGRHRDQNPRALITLNPSIGGPCFTLLTTTR